MQASIALIRNVNFSLWLVNPSSVSLKQIHEMLLGQRVPQSHKLGRPHMQLLPESPPWKLTKHINIVKALRSPAANTLLTNYLGFP